MLEIKNLEVSAENKPILRGINLVIKPGEVHAIMGPNGSGKSTLSNTIAGHPNYKVGKRETGNEKPEMSIIVDSEDITEAEADVRAMKGIYLSAQYPVAIPGLSTMNFLWQIYKKKLSADEQQKKPSLLEFRKWMINQAEALGLDTELLKRSINDGFSGGEKKKTEILQMLVSNPKYVILDEIDSGLDVDALKKIALTVAKIAKERNIGVLVITHYSRILRYLKPTHVHIMKGGKIVKEGGDNLVLEVETKGFTKDEQ